MIAAPKDSLFRLALAVATNALAGKVKPAALRSPILCDDLDTLARDQCEQTNLTCFLLTYT